ncbi:MAG: hypothetical protein CMM28_14140 [Rhodospirillaceae bacterium]|nr:hypothetical protein [Rhodospirillaceae bacterium]
MHVNNQLFFAVDGHWARRVGFERMWVAFEAGFVCVIGKIAADELHVRIIAQSLYPFISIVE